MKDEADERRAEAVIQESRKRWAVMYTKPTTSTKRKSTPKKQAPVQTNGDNSGEIGLLGADTPIAYNDSSSLTL